MKSLNNYKTDFFFIVNLDKILDVIDSHKYITIINVIFRINDKLVILTLIIKIEVFKIFNFLYLDKFIVSIIDFISYFILYILI